MVANKAILKPMKSIFPKTPATDFEKFIFLRAFCKTQSRVIKLQNDELINAKRANKTLHNKISKLNKKLTKKK